MKKFIVLLLAALMIVGLFASCKNEPKKEDPNSPTVYFVGNEIFSCFMDFQGYVADLLTEAETPADLELALEAHFSYPDEGITAEATVTKSSILVEASDADNINTFKVDLSELSLDDEHMASGEFAIKYSQRTQGFSAKLDTKGSFEIDGNTLDKTIECTSVIVDGIDYKVEKFNEFLKEIN